MLCKYPLMAGVVPLRCGKCLPCRIFRRDLWANRQWFESLTHEENCFVTLTYNDSTVPRSGLLEPDVLQLWLKRFRTAISPYRVRFFAVGEYGDRSLRPHYHVNLFGLSGHTIFDAGRNKGVQAANIIEQTWGRGFIKVGDFNQSTARYVCEYTVKGMRDDKKAFAVPEFARMSNRPGIGAPAMKVIAEAVLRSPDKLLEFEGDVPPYVLLGKRKIYLGQYLLNKLREACGVDEAELLQIKKDKSISRSLELLTLFKAAEAYETERTPRQIYLQEIEGRLRQVEYRARFHGRERREL